MIRRERPKQQRALETKEILLESAGRIFTQMSYVGARLKDIATESGMSEGTIYFHFGNKADIASAVIDAQQERMTAVLAHIQSQQNTGIDKLLLTFEHLAFLISKDPVVQGGINLAGQLEPPIDTGAREPYFEWIQITKTLIRLGIEDGSIDCDIDVDGAAEFINVLFVGAQNLSKVDDGWDSLPARTKKLRPYILTILEPKEVNADYN